MLGRLVASDYILILFVYYSFYSLVQESKRMCKMLKRDSKLNFINKLANII